ncbi:glycosyltransferase 87 family protein [Streptomyces sp. NPDC088116]|uniref:glycosyltransferase 87 family protein n=1 Tax=Streptomyces sp. NPDC088116 TaxID=3365825 RepID=UPI0038279DA6
MTEPLAWLACAGFAVLLAAGSTLGTHRVWAVTAAVGYGAAAVTMMCSRARSGARGGAGVGAVTAALIPLIALVLADSAQLEVRVVEDAAHQLLESGSPYDPEPGALKDFNPYLPGMALFGIPAALTGDGPLGDPRWWFALCFLAAMAGAARVAAAGPEANRRVRTALVWLVACPPVALSLAVSGIDLPVIGLACLGLAFASRGRAGGAGLVLGGAAVLKWTAWPVVAVALVLLTARYGRGPAGRFAAITGAVALVFVAPVALRDPAAFVQHVIAFPLGFGDAPSPAASPLPGQLLSRAFPGGDVVALVLLCAGAVLMAASLVLRPPTGLIAAADRTALGLGLAITLAPATRYGYLLYPLILFAWFRGTHGARSQGTRVDGFRGTRSVPTRGGAG